jgi:U3 small nucleolar ribonucleoprotein component
MNMDKTKFAHETGSEEIDLGHFLDDDDEEEKENDVYEDFDTLTTPVQTSSTPQRSNNLKEKSMNKSFENHSSSSRSSATCTTKNKPIMGIRCSNDV